MIWLYLFLLACVAGTLGRMGGAGKEGQWYEKILDTKWRDAGCPLILLLAISLFVPFNPSLWWAYLLSYALMWAALSTYFDKLFGYDNLWFSGFMTGVAVFPLGFINPWFWLIVPLRAVALCVIWGCLNKYLPKKGILCWRRDVAEEFLRYFCSL